MVKVFNLSMKDLHCSSLVSWKNSSIPAVELLLTRHEHHDIFV